MEAWSTSSEFAGMKRVSCCCSLLALVLMGLFILSCQGTLPVRTQPMIGQTILKSSQIPLDKSGESSGNFRDGYVKVSFKYRPVGDGLKMSGSVWFEDAVLMNYLFVNTFHMDILLADDRGRVLSQQSIATAVNMNVTDSIDFITSIFLPPQAAYVAFTYTGQVHGVEESPTSIWYYPFAR